jgi:hypothetical protein
MANQPFDREIINLRERPLSSDVNRTSTELDQSIRVVLQAAHLFRTTANVQDLVAMPMLAALTAGFHGNGFNVRASSPAALNVVIEPGLGWYNDNASVSTIDGIVGLDDPNTHKPLVMPAALTYALAGASAPDPINPRIDIIEVKVARATGDPTSRDVLNPGTGVFAPNVVNKTLSYVNSPITTNGSGGINYKTGVAAAIPVAPAVDPGYVKIAEVLVDAAAVSVAQNKIRDFRRLIFPGGVGHVFGTSAGAALLSCRGTAGVSVTMTRAALVDSYFIFAGDGSATVHTVFEQFGGAGFNDTRISAITGGSVTAPIQAALAAATPSLAVAIGQPFIQIDLTQDTIAQNQVYHILLANS